MKCAVVMDGIVINIIIADPSDVAPAGGELIPIGNMPCQIGWGWDGQSFAERA